MDGAHVDITDPPLTRRELRRREEAARAQETASNSADQEPWPDVPQEPAALPQRAGTPSSGRVPRWAIDEAAGRPAQDTTWRGHTTPAAYDWETLPGASPQAYVPPSVRYPSPPKRFLRALGRTFSDIFASLWSCTKFLVLTGVLLAAIWNGLTYLAPAFTADAGEILDAHGITNTLEDVFPWAQPKISDGGAGAPPPGLEASDRPLGAPAPVAASSDSYAFLRAGTDQSFVSYDPCRPIHYVVRPDHAPAGGGQAIEEAVAAVSRATGFVFINDGSTTEAPSLERPAHQPDRYGDRWAPVLFAWETQFEQPQFTENWAPGSSTTLGLGGSLAVSVNDQNPTYVTGQVRLNAAALGTMARGTNGYTRVKAVVQHELAHVVGLDHIADPTQLMTASMTSQVFDFGAGDLAGLAILGKGKCRPEL